jgi:uncharacterized membrane protein YgcG
MFYVGKLDTPLLRLSPDDAFTLRDACGGVHVFGGIGSGKTSGSGHALAGGYLRANMGGLVLAAKPEEVELWQRYAAAHGRSASVVLFDENEGFNFLAYELARQGMDGIGSVTECLMRILEAARSASPTVSGKGGEAFWEDATRQILRYAIPPIYAARGTVSIRDIIDFLISAPTSTAQALNDANWMAQSFMYSVMQAAEHAPKVPMTRAELRQNISYWCDQFPAIPEKTRGNIIISVSTVLDRFKHGRLQRAFCGKTTIVPEMCFHGAIIIMAMPALTWNEDGIIGQQLFKYMWQRAVLARNSLPRKHRERPVFLWADEAQYFCNSFDAEYQSACRASRACTVFLTQSLPTYYAKMGGDKARDSAHALVGKFMTHIFHSNACPETNEWAAKAIGKVLQRRSTYNEGQSTNTNLGMNKGDSINRGQSFSSGRSSGSGGGSANSNSGSTSGSGSNWGDSRGRGRSDSTSHGYNETMDFLIEPGDFGRMLKTGGPANRGMVTGVWYQAGRNFAANGYNILVETFRQ